MKYLKIKKDAAGNLDDVKVQQADLAGYAGTATNYDTTTGTIKSKFDEHSTRIDDAKAVGTQGLEKSNANASEITKIKNGTTIVPNANMASHAGTATNYDTTVGNIKSKFEELEEKIDSGGKLPSTGTPVRPVWINSDGKPEQITIRDSISPTGLSSANSELITERKMFFALPMINDNSANTYSYATSIYAPIVAGTSKSLLVSNGKGAPYWNRNYLSDRTSLYSSSSLSTGNKTLKQSALNFSVIFFSLKGESNSEHYPFWIPRSEYQGRNSTNNKLCLASCEANKNQYINMYYVNDTTFNISSFEKIITLEIWGIA